MDSSRLLVGGVISLTTVDYPDHLAAVVFLQGCPWRCVYCHNPHLQTISPEESLPWEDVLNLLSTRIGFIEGVVFSGGEPLMQCGLRNAIKCIKEMGFLIGLHTSGYNPEILDDIISITDWIGFDIKTIFERYHIITHNDKSGEMAEKSFQILLQSNISYEIRTTLDSRHITFDELKQIANMLKEKGVAKWVIQECILRRAGVDTRLDMISDEEIGSLNKIINIEIRRQ